MNLSIPPLVSVIIPAYNAQEFISQTLDSILAQTYQNIEIIVVDDGSTDRTPLIVDQYKNEVAYFYQDNSGGCAVPRNKGILESSGEFLCFNDADDLMVSDRIETQVNFLLQNPTVGLVFSDYRNFCNNEYSPKTHFETCPNFQSYLQMKKELIIDKACPFLARENFGIAGSFMLRRALLSLQEYYFETSLKSSEDFHFYYRLSRSTRVGIINKVGMLRRLHTNNMSGNKERMMSECIKSYTMLCESENDFKAKYFLNRFISYFWSDLSRHNANNGRYLKAFLQELKALSHNYCLASLFRLFKMSIRIILMKSGIYKPSEKSI